MSKIRCPLRPASMRLDRDRPEILQAPEHSGACCAQQAITVPADVLAKTAQKHDYPSAAWRRSNSRRTGAERGFATGGTRRHATSHARMSEAKRENRPHRNVKTSWRGLHV
jgi:hypothetical protein